MMPAPPLRIWDHRSAIAVRTRERSGPSIVTAGSAAALVVGCLAGLAVSWHGILSDGARDRIYSAFTGLGYTATASAGQNRAAAEAQRPATDGMAGVMKRLSEKPLAVWPKSTAALISGMDMRSPRRLQAWPLGSLDQLALVEETGPVVERSAAVGAPPAAMEITFDVNSSFLGPNAVGALRELVRRLAVGRSSVLDVRATVSDDGVKTADPGEAYRYNRWLAERRAERVRNWLARHGPPGLGIEPGLLDHDASRRVVIALRQVR